MPELCRLIRHNDVLKPGGLLYLEQDRREPEPELPADWQLFKSKNAGNVRYSLIRSSGENDARAAGR